MIWYGVGSGTPANSEIFGFPERFILFRNRNSEFKMTESNEGIIFVDLLNEIKHYLVQDNFSRSENKIWPMRHAELMYVDRLYLY